MLVNHREMASGQPRRQAEETSRAGVAGSAPHEIPREARPLTLTQHRTQLSAAQLLSLGDPWRAIPV